MRQPRLADEQMVAILRQAERHATAEHMDAGGMFLWFVLAQSTLEAASLTPAHAQPEHAASGGGYP